MIRALRLRHRRFAWLVLIGGLVAVATAVLVRPAPLGPGPLPASRSGR